MSRILLAVGEGTGQVIRTALSERHELVIVDSIADAQLQLDARAFDAVICDVGFDSSQLFQLWNVVRHSNHHVPFIAFREGDSESGLSMESMVQTAILNLGLYYLDLREFACALDLSAVADFVEASLPVATDQPVMVGNRLAIRIGMITRRRRLNLSMELEELSHLSGVPCSVLLDLENGKAPDLELTQLFRIAMSLGFGMSNLIKAAEEFERIRGASTQS